MWGRQLCRWAPLCPENGIPPKKGESPAHRLRRALFISRTGQNRIGGYRTAEKLLGGGGVGVFSLAAVLPPFDGENGDDQLDRGNQGHEQGPAVGKDHGVVDVLGEEEGHNGADGRQQAEHSPEALALELLLLRFTLAGRCALFPLLFPLFLADKVEDQQQERGDGGGDGQDQVCLLYTSRGCRTPWP